MPIAQLATPQLLELLSFRTEVMSQMLLVATFMAVLAMTVAAVLLSTTDRSRLRSILLVVLIASTLLFVVATMLDACILPFMKHATVSESPDRLRGLITLASIVVYQLILAAALLFGAIGSLGFAYTRRVGLWTASTAAALSVVFVLCCFYLSAVLKR